MKATVATSSVMMILFVIAHHPPRLFFFIDTATTEIYTVMNTLSLHDALPISRRQSLRQLRSQPHRFPLGQRTRRERSEEHTSELQSLITSSYAVFCLQKKKKREQPIRRPESRRLLPRTRGDERT